MTAAATSRPAVTATTCADLHGYGRRLPLLSVNGVWTVWRYVGAPTISVVYTNMSWTMVAVMNDTSSTLKPVHRTVLTSVYFTTWEETAPRPHRTPPSRRGITTYAMRWGPWSRVAECTALAKRREPRWRHSTRGSEGHHVVRIKETPFRSEVSLALFQIVFCR